MSNTLHGPFVAGGSTSTGHYGTGGGQVNTYTSGNVNYDETQSATALASFNPDLITAGFVLSGVTCAKDGTTASQLDVASGRAYLVVSDGTLARCDVASTTFSTSGHPSTTMYLDLNPDGTWSWGTSHSGVSNHLTICTVTTDGSANIASVSDTRPRNVELLTAMGTNGGALVDLQALGLLAPDLGAGKRGSIGHLDGTNGSFSNAIFFNTPASGASAQGFYFAVWNGTLVKIPLSIGGSFGGAASYFDASGLLNAAGIASIAGQATAGSFGAAAIVAQALNTHVTATTQQTILSYTVPATGWYRVNVYLTLNNGTSGQAPLLSASWYDGNSGLSSTREFIANVGPGPITILSGSEGTFANGAYAPLPVTVYAQASGHNITVTYQDSANTPNDYVTAIIERLA